jgi:hypothetical protein
MDEYRAVCPRILGNELTAAECKNLTGGWPDAEGKLNSYFFLIVGK